MSFFKDIFSMFKKEEVLFLRSYQETEHIYTFLFEKPNNLIWKPGQYSYFTIIHKKIPKPARPLSLASAPEENIVKVTVEINDNPSDFKKAMLELEKGTKMKISGPVGSFYLKDDCPTLLIAGGIGITPFRSMLKQLEVKQDSTMRQIKMLYIDSRKPYIYQDELDKISNNTSINVTHVDSRNELYQEIDKYIALYNNDGNYFVAGSESMVKSISNYLRKSDISKRSIKKDVLVGIN